MPDRVEKPVPLCCRDRDETTLCPILASLLAELVCYNFTNDRVWIVDRQAARSICAATKDIGNRLE